MNPKQQKAPSRPLKSDLAGESPNEKGGGMPTRPYQPKRQRKSIKLDRVNPRDLARYDVRFFCDDCSHYSPSQDRCTMGYVAQHRREKQMELFNLGGMMAFCRFLEID